MIAKSWLIDKLSDDVALQNVVMSITCTIENDDKFYPQTFFRGSISASDQ